MEKQITLDEYLSSRYPYILEAYRRLVEKRKELTAEDICNMELDTKGLTSKAVKELRKLDITTIGKLIRVLLIYGSINWLNGVGVATTNRLYENLRSYEVNVKEPSLTDNELRSYAMEFCRRDLNITIEGKLDDKTYKVLADMSITTIIDIIKWLQKNNSFDMVKALAGYQRDSIMTLLNEYARYPECVKYEFI